ncbi:hypothetical protein VR45_26745 [Streptomyces sp. NRRL S-495]|nr:hypothetical protein VR45_26745 [Streptomyces sp. NRRL S-495]
MQAEQPQHGVRSEGVVSPLPEVPLHGHSPAVSQRRRPSLGEVRQVRASPFEEVAVAPASRHLRWGSLQLPFFLPGISAQFSVS